MSSSSGSAVHPLQDYDPVNLPELIESVIDSKVSTYTLESLHKAILARPSDEEIDPLAVFPILLPSAINGTDALLRTIGVRCSPREALIALQEAGEKLGNFDHDEELDDSDNIVPPSAQLARVLAVYSIVLPRLNKRRKTASEILRPLMFQVQGSIPAVSQHPDADARELIRSFILLTTAIPEWVGGDPKERRIVATILGDVLRDILQYNANSVHAGLTEQAFERQYPNLRVPGKSKDEPSDIPASRIVADAIDALVNLDLDVNDLITPPSLSSLILIAHSAQPRLTEGTLEAFLPIILAALQSNSALDETLALLLETFGHLRDMSPRPDLPIDILIPLVHVLAPLASIHPDPDIRHATFRVLSIVLSLCPSLVRLRLLKDLVTDENEAMQQMRVAAVGLVKEAALKALSTPSTTSGPPNIFLSPIFMEEIGSTLFLKQADNVAPTVEKFLESAEPLRLIESMGLLYVLLLRDRDNRTGVKEHSFLREVERTTLAPLKARLVSWEKEIESSPELEHAAMQLAIIDMWLVRLYSIVENLRS